jgi:hypothetical protein
VVGGPATSVARAALPPRPQLFPPLGLLSATIRGHEDSRTTHTLPVTASTGSRAPTCLIHSFTAHPSPPSALVLAVFPPRHGAVADPPRAPYITHTVNCTRTRAQPALAHVSGLVQIPDPDSCTRSLSGYQQQGQGCDLGDSRSWSGNEREQGHGGVEGRRGGRKGVKWCVGPWLSLLRSPC